MGSLEGMVKSNSKCLLRRLFQQQSWPRKCCGVGPDWNVNSSRTQIRLWIYEADASAFFNPEKIETCAKPICIIWIVRRLRIGKFTLLKHSSVSLKQYRWGKFFGGTCTAQPYNCHVTTAMEASSFVIIIPLCFCAANHAGCFCTDYLISGISKGFSSIKIRRNKKGDYFLERSRDKE